VKVRELVEAYHSDFNFARTIGYEKAIGKMISILHEQLDMKKLLARWMISILHEQLDMKKLSARWVRVCSLW